VGAFSQQSSSTVEFDREAMDLPLLRRAVGKPMTAPNAAP
jgi:hypothetical protein